MLGAAPTAQTLRLRLRLRLCQRAADDARDLHLRDPEALADLCLRGVFLEAEPEREAVAFSVAINPSSALSAPPPQSPDPGWARRLRDRRSRLSHVRACGRR